MTDPKIIIKSHSLETIAHAEYLNPIIQELKNKKQNALDSLHDAIRRTIGKADFDTEMHKVIDDKRMVDFGKDLPDASKEHIAELLALETNRWDEDQYLSQYLCWLEIEQNGGEEQAKEKSRLAHGGYKPLLRAENQTYQQACRELQSFLNGISLEDMEAINRINKEGPENALKPEKLEQEDLPYTNLPDKPPFDPEPIIPEQFVAGLKSGYLKPRYDGNYDLYGISTAKFFRSLMDEGLPMDSAMVFKGKLFKKGKEVKNIDQILSDVKSGKAGSKTY